MRRSQAVHETSVGLFAFLDVLMSTMGSLILVLMIVSPKIRQEKIAKAATEVARDVVKIEAKPAPPTPAPAPVVAPKRETIDLNAKFATRVAELTSQADEKRHAAADAQRDLATARDRSQKVHETREQLEHELAELRAAKTRMLASVEDLSAEGVKVETELARRGSRLRKIRDHIAHESTEYSFVAYDGVSGTTRRPILIECADDQLKFVQENITLTSADITGFTNVANPLLSGAEALIDYWSTHSAPNEPKPYVLMVVRPSGTLSYYRARNLLERMKAPFGYELLPEDQKLAPPATDPQAALACREAIDRAIAKRDAVFNQVFATSGGTRRDPLRNGPGGAGGDHPGLTGNGTPGGSMEGNGVGPGRSGRGAGGGAGHTWTFADPFDMSSPGVPVAGKGTAGGADALVASGNAAEGTGPSGSGQSGSGRSGGGESGTGPGGNGPGGNTAGGSGAGGNGEGGNGAGAGSGSAGSGGNGLGGIAQANGGRPGHGSSVTGLGGPLAGGAGGGAGTGGSGMDAGAPGGLPGVGGATGSQSGSGRSGADGHGGTGTSDNLVAGVPKGMGTGGVPGATGLGPGETGTGETAPGPSGFAAGGSGPGVRGADSAPGGTAGQPGGDLLAGAAEQGANGAVGQTGQTGRARPDASFELSPTPGAGKGPGMDGATAADSLGGELGNFSGGESRGSSSNGDLTLSGMGGSPQSGQGTEGSSSEFGASPTTPILQAGSGSPLSAPSGGFNSLSGMSGGNGGGTGQPDALGSSSGQPASTALGSGTSGTPQAASDSGTASPQGGSAFPGGPTSGDPSGGAPGGTSGSGTPSGGSPGDAAGGSPGGGSMGSDGGDSGQSASASVDAKAGGGGGPSLGHGGDDTPDNSFAKHHWGYSTPQANVGFNHDVNVWIGAHAIVVGSQPPIPITRAESTQRLAALVVPALDREARTWGRPPDHLYWVPAVKFVVSPGGNVTYDRLRPVLERHGLISSVEYRLELESPRQTFHSWVQ